MQVNMHKNLTECNFDYVLLATKNIESYHRSTCEYMHIVSMYLILFTS